jgi:hypothetical protein
MAGSRHRVLRPPSAWSRCPAVIQAAGNLRSTDPGLKSHFQPFCARFRRSHCPEDVPALADVSEILPAVFCLPIVRPADPVVAALRAFFHVGSQLRSVPGSLVEFRPLVVARRAPSSAAQRSARARVTAKLVAPNWTTAPFSLPPNLHTWQRFGNLLGLRFEVNGERVYPAVRDG